LIKPVKKVRIIHIILLIILPLVIGFYIYAAYRPASIGFFSPVDRLVKAWAIPPIIPIDTRQPGIFARFLLFYLPDICWAFALANALALVWWHRVRSPLRLYAGIATLVAASEILQYWTPRHFTFDWYDLLAAIVAVVLSYSCLKKIKYG
jgi:hypothetical protein